MRGSVCCMRVCMYIWAASSEFGTYRLCEQRRFRRACADAQARQNLRCSLIQAVSQEEPSDRKPDPWPLWMAGHAQLKIGMTECSKTQIRLTRSIWWAVCVSVSLGICESLMLKAYRVCYDFLQFREMRLLLGLIQYQKHLSTIRKTEDWSDSF